MRSPALLSLAAALALTAAHPASAAESTPVGLADLQIADPAGLRPLQVHVLYPAEPGGTPIQHSDDRVRYGFEVLEDAPPAAGRFPLVLISHGLYGRWRNYGWLARRLAAEGMIVASPTHPGTAWTNRDTPETAKLWERPRDLSRVIDHLTAAPDWRARIAPGRIATIGHSLGGYTVMAAAGARFDSGRYAAYCTAHPERADCLWYERAGLGSSPAEREELDRSLKDPRIAATVSYDLGFTQAFDPASLAGIATPVLVIGAGAHMPDLPVAAESRHLAALLPKETARYHEIADISHFSIFPRCKPGAAEILAAAGNGDEIICGDGGGRDRAALHDALSDLILDFLAEAGVLP